MPRPINPNTFQKKICPTCQKEFTFKSYKPKTYCCKTCSTNSPEVKEKNRQGIKKTFQEKYGGHAMKNNEVKENFKKAMKDKYGVEHYSQLPEWKTEVRQTLKERYGSETFNNVSQREQTCLIKYGVKNPMQYQEIKEHSHNEKRKVHFNFIIKYAQEKNLTPLFTFDDYNGYHYEHKYKFTCNKCGTTFETDIYLLSHIFCEKCFPLLKRTGENTLYDFLTEELKGIIIERRNRTILNKQELDFYISHLKLAIEYNGIYWHSEKNGIKRRYHLNKTKNCLFHGINLIHILETEWNNKQEIVKSILKQKFGKSQFTIGARECQIKNISHEEKSKFLEENHIQGNDRSAIYYGLLYKNNPISVMSFCKSRFDQKIEWEMSRFCNKLNHNIVGGASKLLNRFIKDHKPKSIVSYCDRRYFIGNVYEKLNFKFIGNTPPNYHYISKDYKILYNRMGFQKGKLSKLLTKFDPDLSEWENMKINGFDRIWDCGNLKYVMFLT